MLRSGIRSASFNAPRRSARSCTQPTDSCGFGCPASGRIGVRRWSSSSPKQSLPGTARHFASSGRGRSGEASPGVRPVPREVRDLIRRMSKENPGWGAPRIHGELLKLGINIGETSVSKYLVRNRKPPSQTWRTFLENHMKSPCVRRLLYRPDDPVSGPLRLPRACARASAHPSLRGHGTSDCRVDCTAAPGSFSVGQRAALSAARSGPHLRA